MLNPIVPSVGSAEPIDPIAATSPTPATGGVQRPQGAGPVEATTLDTISASPPAEVMDAVSAAHSLHGELQASGRQVSFHVGDNGRVTMRVDDLQGNPLSLQLPGSRVFDLLDGEPVA